MATTLGLTLGCCIAELSSRIWMEAPQFDSPDFRFGERLFEMDPILRYRLRANLDVPWSEGTKVGSWNGHLRTDEEGWRLPKFESGSGAPLRVAFLGDSSTMGYYVDDEEHYPFLAGVYLASSLPERRVATTNYGVAGYTSEQGRRLLSTSLRDTPLEYVVLAFGYNDGFLAQRHEQDWLQAVPTPLWMPFHTWLSDRFSFYRVLWKDAHPERVYEALQPRVPRDRFESNLSSMIKTIHGRGARAIVLDLDLPNSYMRESMRTIASANQALHISCSELFERELAATLDEEAIPQKLQGNDASSVRFRARGWNRPVLVAFDLSKRERIAWIVPGNDQGIFGDAKAGDGITTWLMTIPGNRMHYDFAIIGQPVIEAAPQHLNYLFYRELELRTGQGFDSPIYDPSSWQNGWNRLLLEGESVHPSAEGLKLIAREVANLIERDLSR